MNSIQLNSKLCEDLGMDSLYLVELIMDIEQEYKITISDEEIDKIITVKNAVEVINMKTKERNSQKKITEKK